MVTDDLIASVRKHEGLRLKAYQDSEGIWTIGYGRNMQEMTIGLATAERWLAEDLRAADLEAQSFPEWMYLDTQARRDVLVEMVFNMGAPRVKGFKRMLEAIRASKWALAAQEMLDSQWAEQVGRRAYRLSDVMKRGRW
jgi:lysozyme